MESINLQGPLRRKDWEEIFACKLKTRHGRFHKKVFKKLMTKSSTLRSSLRQRSRKNDVFFKMTLTEIRKMFYDSYNKPCRYCGTLLDVKNMVCDHIVPIASKGASISTNLEMICRQCNTRKGPLSDKHYARFVHWIAKQPLYVSKYIMRKMAAKEVFR